jgi:TonB family protein
MWRIVMVITAAAWLTPAANASGKGPSPLPELSPTPPSVHVERGAHARALAISKPQPRYPYEARKNHWVGVGWYVMHIDDNTGLVTSVDIIQSTGHEMLDKAVVDAFKRWRFKPHSGLRKVKSPVTFSMPVKRSNHAMQPTARARTASVSDD